jgi:hypothetical protein
MKQLITCSFAMSSPGKSGSGCYKSVGLQTLAPQPDETSFDVWWEKVSERVLGQVKNGLNSIISLEHRNRCCSMVLHLT